MDGVSLVPILVIAAVVVLAVAESRRKLARLDRQAEEMATAPQSLTEARFEDGRLVVSHPIDGEVSLALADIVAVAIETEGSGLSRPGAAWLIRAGDESVRVPVVSEGEDGLFEWVQALPGVDNEAIAFALGGTTRGRIPVWQRDDEGAPAAGEGVR